MMCPGADNLKNVCCIRKLVISVPFYEMNVIFVKSDSIIVAIVILFILQLQIQTQNCIYSKSGFPLDRYKHKL